jgi:hypothetical protein
LQLAALHPGGTDMTSPKAHDPEPDDVERSETPARKKKKKRKQQGAPRWLLLTGLGVGGVAVVVLLGLFIWIGSRFAFAPPVQAVTSWEKYTAEENEFAFEYPAGWRAKSYGVRNQREAEVKGSGASISIKENLTGSLIADIAGAIGGGIVDDDHLPVVSVHEVRRPKDSTTYKEAPAVTVTTRFGKARRSAYTDGSKRGYRATVLLNQTALDVFCECRASDWQTLRPAFEHVIESLGRP